MTKLVWVALLGIGISACGGGGGSDTGGPTTDSVAPTVSSTSPVNNATGVAKNAAITASFDETMAGASFGVATFTLQQGATDVPGAVTYNGSTATLTPTASLAYSTTYTATVTTGVTDAAGNALYSDYVWTFTTAAAPSLLTDTGITGAQCYAAGSNALVACNSAGALALNDAQDGMRGRDVSSPDHADGRLGFSYSVVGAYDKSECVQDNFTGLMWEGKTASGTRAGGIPYTNYGDGRAGDASAYVGTVNAARLCGFTDWRPPTANELQTLVDYGAAYPGPTIDTNWFPNTPGSMFWSSSPYLGYAYDAWGVYFYNGSDDGNYRHDYYPVRLVRAGQFASSVRYTVSADEEEVTDTRTGLIWRRCAEGMTAGGGTCTGSAGGFTHEAALQRATAQAGSTGKAWRLPNVKELSSIADKSRTIPAIDTTAFPATPSDSFWSSSPFVGNSGYAWYVGFNLGGVHFIGGSRGYNLRVRLVRAGQ